MCDTGDCMKSRVPNSLQAYTPPIRRRRGPVVSGLYTQPKNPNRIKLPQVRKLMNKACVVMPWIRGEHLPTLRKWCEMELIRLAAFSAITQDGILSVDRKTKDIGARRLGARSNLAARRRRYCPLLADASRMVIFSVQSARHGVQRDAATGFLQLVRMK